MFGNNPQLGVERRADGAVIVREVFRTFQGEGPLTGTPSVFVRLAGCNLACTFCDTDFDMDSSFWMTPAVVLDAVGKEDPTGKLLIVLTGGEPLRQGLSKLLAAFGAVGRQVQIETSGSVEPDFGPMPGLTVVVSPKTQKLQQGILKFNPSWKYVVEHDSAMSANGIPDSACQGGIRRPLYPPPEGTPTEDVYLQPCDHIDVGLNAAATIKAMNACLVYGYRLSVQVHKVLGLR